MIHRFSVMVAAGLVAAGALAWSSNMRLSAADAAPQVQTDAHALATLPEVDSCTAIEFGQAALENARSLTDLQHSPFGRGEVGWEIYAPKIAADIGTSCEPESSGFAEALARYQAVQGDVADGIMTSSLFAELKALWQNERAYVALRASGVCPDAPSEALLTRLTADEGYRGKSIMLRDEVASAYRAMIAAARTEDPAIAADPDALDIFSGFRSPAYDAARCARDGNCGGVTRAKCSAHRTGYTFDLVVGSAPGQSVDSTDDKNRLHMSRTPAYRWLVANAERFGFVNYVFEPWHWEYVGQDKTPGLVQASVH